MLRGLASILIGALLALLVALASLFVLVPILGHAGQGIAQVVAVAVFCAVMLLVVRAVRR